METTVKKVIHAAVVLAGSILGAGSLEATSNKECEPILGTRWRTAAKREVYSQGRNIYRTTITQPAGCMFSPGIVSGSGWTKKFVMVKGKAVRQGMVTVSRGCKAVLTKPGGPEFYQAGVDCRVGFTLQANSGKKRQFTFSIHYGLLKTPATRVQGFRILHGISVQAGPTTSSAASDPPEDDVKTFQAGELAGPTTEEEDMTEDERESEYYPSNAMPRCDIDDDGIQDLVIFHSNHGGVWSLRPSSGSGMGVTLGGAAGDIPLCGDVNGDGMSDLAIYSANGIWSVRDSANGAVQVFRLGGRSGDVPLLGDYDGDFQCDLAVYNRNSGLWTIRHTGDGWVEEKLLGGSGGDIPVVGDYDGDGTTDLAIYHSQKGGGPWSIIRSSDESVWRLNWGGLDGDLPVSGDFDRDGVTDVAVFHSKIGGNPWSIRRSSNGTGFAISWGGHNGDIPAPGDYDGDGETDLAVYHSKVGGGPWSLRRSMEGGTAIYWGGHLGDVPVGTTLIPR